jgi:hypothetical protein
VALAALAAASAAIACGPFFPLQLLDDRTGTLTATPANGFAFEARHLVTPGDDLKAVEPPRDAYPPVTPEAARVTLESEDLPPPEARAVGDMRKAPSGDAAYARGGALPAGIRLYTAGAVDFRHAQMASAARRFAAVLQHPADARPARATWAAFMLGRIHARDGALEDAARAFQSVRALARDGAPDPLGLAVASYGEEARLHWERAKALSDDDPGYRGAVAAAVALYAEQAARGSAGGLQSLRIVAEALVGEPKKLATAAADPLTQRLIVAYMLARIDDDYVGSGSAATHRPPDALGALVDAIEQRGLAPAAGADRLAALAYRTGRYDIAARLADTTGGPLAAWVRAKLAVQSDDLAAAAALYAEATQGFPTADPALPLDSTSARLVVGERGVVALARGEYVEALLQLYRARYWGDVAYIAERVLTTDELERVVATLPALLPATDDGRIGDVELYDDAPADMADKLRDLLARRLVREGRRRDAARYFRTPEVAAQAAAYDAALDQAASRWSGVGRARGWYAAAAIEREAGLEIMGYEASPDYAHSGGNFDGGLGRATLEDGPLVTDGERARFAATVAVPERRWHYRYVAVDQALRAAALLPPRSQAFAAVLCQATGWMLGTPGEATTVAALYKLYVADGPYVPWAADFGRDCPQPDFDGAARLTWTRPLALARHAARRNLAWLAPLLGLALAGVGWLAWRRRPGIDIGRTS